MPTGYTAAIQEGCTFNEFLLSCAKAFGACIDMRDEPHDKPIPDAFEPSSYHLEQQQSEVTELAGLRMLTDEEANKRAEKAYLEEVDFINAQIAKSQEILKKYRVMLVKVGAWNPPSPDHEGLAKFMVEQIQSSIEFDDMTDWYQKKQSVKLSGFVWKEKKCAELVESIARHAKEYAEECDRIAERNKWVRQLRESLS